MSQVPREPELAEIEAALRALAPSPSRLDRDRLMFEAGARSRDRRPLARWAWPAVAALLTIVVAGESLLLAYRPSPRVVERLVVVREPSRPVEGPPSPRQVDAHELMDDVPPPRLETVADYHRRRDFLSRFGLDSVPDPARWEARAGRQAEGTGTSPASVGELRRLEAEKWLNPGDRS